MVALAVWTTMTSPFCAAVRAYIAFTLASNPAGTAGGAAPSRAYQAPSWPPAARAIAAAPRTSTATCSARATCSGTAFACQRAVMIEGAVLAFGKVNRLCDRK